MMLGSDGKWTAPAYANPPGYIRYLVDETVEDALNYDKRLACRAYKDAYGFARAAACDDRATGKNLAFAVAKTIPVLNCGSMFDGDSDGTCTRTTWTPTHQKIQNLQSSDLMQVWQRAPSAGFASCHTTRSGVPSGEVYRSVHAGEHPLGQRLGPCTR